MVVKGGALPDQVEISSIEPVYTGGECRGWGYCFNHFIMLGKFWSTDEPGQKRQSDGGWLAMSRSITPVLTWFFDTVFLVYHLNILFYFFPKSSGGWLKRKLRLPHFHVSDTYMSCVNLTRRSRCNSSLALRLPGNFLMPSLRLFLMQPGNMADATPRSVKKKRGHDYCCCMEIKKGMARNTCGSNTR